MATMDDAIAIAKQRFGPNATDYEIRLIYDELQAQKIRDVDPRQIWLSTDPIQGLAGSGMADFPPDVWMAALNAAERFAANTSWRFFPTLAQLNEMIYTGVDFTNDREVAQQMAAWLPADVVQKMPWTAAGMSHGAWKATLESVKDSWEDLTGDRAYIEAHIQDFYPAIQQGWSQHRLEEFWRKDPNVQARYGWIKYGFNYNSWQQHKNDPSVRQAIVTRFGTQALASDQAFLEELEHPLERASAVYGSPVRFGGAVETSKVGIQEVR